MKKLNGSTLSVRLDSELCNKFTDHCHNKGSNITDVLRGFIISEVNKPETNISKCSSCEHDHKSEGKPFVEPPYINLVDSDGITKKLDLGLFRRVLREAVLENFSQQ